MDLFQMVGITAADALIDWEITPAATYGLFECRGDMTKVRSCRERYYYFYIDNWQQPATLCFMERGLRHARVLATIAAPRELIDRAVAEQGRALKEQNYAINPALRQWLEGHVLAGQDMELVTPAVVALPVKPAADPVLIWGEVGESPLRLVRLRAEPAMVQEGEIAGLVTAGNFFESRLNPAGNFEKRLIDTRDGLTVGEQATGLVWQRAGAGLMSYRKALAWCAARNEERFAGRAGWRLPTIEEALSLLTLAKNSHGFHLHGCFAPDQGFIFTADRRRPGGHWFVDFRQATVYWAAGTPFAGGFVRACCTNES